MDDKQIRNFLDEVQIGDYIWVKYKTEFLKRQREYVVMLLGLL